VIAHILNLRMASRQVKAIGLNTPVRRQRAGPSRLPNAMQEQAA